MGSSTPQQWLLVSFVGFNTIAQEEKLPQVSPQSFISWGGPWEQELGKNRGNKMTVSVTSFWNCLLLTMSFCIHREFWILIKLCHLKPQMFCFVCVLCYVQFCIVNVKILNTVQHWCNHYAVLQNLSYELGWCKWPVCRLLPFLWTHILAHPIHPLLWGGWEKQE